MEHSVAGAGAGAGAKAVTAAETAARQGGRYDVLIVGGGLAGLSAACELSETFPSSSSASGGASASGEEKRVLLLEADNRLGGKVRTGNRDGIVYEAGAVFAFEPRWFPFEIEAGPYCENVHPLGLFHRGRLYTGDSVAECLGALRPEVRRQLCLPHFLGAPSPQEAMIGEDLAAAMRAFFQVIYPWTPTEAVPARRRDCLIRHRIDRFHRGNGAMVDALAARCGAGKVEIRTGCRVYGVEEAPGQGSVRVLWRNENGAAEEASARRVILALPASGARALFAVENKKNAAVPMPNVSTEFLSRVRYGGGIAVVIRVRVRGWRPLAYAVSTQGPFNTFIFYPEADTRGPAEVTVVGYLVGEGAAACGGMGDAELARTMADSLREMGIGDIEDCFLLEARHWPEVGPVVEEAAYRGFSASWLHPLPGVVLAGDYTWWDEELPYGMGSAVASGRRAARLCREPDFLPLSVGSDFGRMPLADTSVFRFTDGGPELTETFGDGTIAYYGLLLQSLQTGFQRAAGPLAPGGPPEGFFAEPPLIDPRELERYLLSEAADDLWGYQQGYGVTSLDSFLVMEGLLSAGGREEQLRRSCRRLTTLFFDREEGGFWTMPVGSAGRAPYWRGVDCPATAACAWLLLRIDPQSYAEEIGLCRDCLLRQQTVSGAWPGKWFPSQSIPIWYALRFFAALEAGNHAPDDAIRAAVRRAAVRLRSGQRLEDGSWGGSVIETAAAVLALEAARGDSPSDLSLERGRRWLRAASAPGAPGGIGEPILSYWFEEGGRRTFFFTRDRGRVSAAWAALALGVRGEARP